MAIVNIITILMCISGSVTYIMGLFLCTVTTFIILLHYQIILGKCRHVGKTTATSRCGGCNPAIYYLSTTEDIFTSWHGSLFWSHKNFLSELPDNFETQVTNILVLSTKFLIRQQQNAELSPYFLFLLGVNFGRETFLWIFCKIKFSIRQIFTWSEEVLSASLLPLTREITQPDTWYY